MTQRVARPAAVAAWARLFAALCVGVLLAGCVSAPSEGQRKQAIADHVLRAEGYPLLLHGFPLQVEPTHGVVRTTDGDHRADRAKSLSGVR